MWKLVLSSKRELLLYPKPTIVIGVYMIIISTSLEYSLLPSYRAQPDVVIPRIHLKSMSGPEVQPDSAMYITVSHYHTLLTFLPPIQRLTHLKRLLPLSIVHDGDGVVSCGAVCRRRLDRRELTIQRCRTLSIKNTKKHKKH